MIAKLHVKDDTTIVSCCDDELIGKIIEDDNKQLDLASDFYKGDKVSEIEAGDLIRNADQVNLVGKQSVALGIKEGVIDQEHILTIKDIPYAQCVVIK